MIYKFICCEVFTREACLLTALSNNTIYPEFTPKGAHDESDKLRTLIQEKIDAADDKNIDAILLGFGLCGNSIAGLTARNVPLVVPRAHDCCTLFLGSRKAFLENFGDNLSAEWSSTGYTERGNSAVRSSDLKTIMGFNRDYEALVEQYGRENADYIWETLNPPKNQDELIFIDVPEFCHLGYGEKMRQKSVDEGKTMKLLKGDIRLLRNLIEGDWNTDEYLIVNPGEKIIPVYDFDEIIKT